MAEHLDLSSLHLALSSLEAALGVVADEAWLAKQSVAVRNTLFAGVVQNFEFVYELGVKMIRRQLELEAASPVEVDQSSFRELLRTAGEKGLVDDVTAWFGYRHLRNLTAHTYDLAKARLVYEGSLAFVRDARALLVALEARRA